MPLFTYDRSLPVTPKENINDVQDMFEQARDFISGGLGGDNLSIASITATQLGDESVAIDSLENPLATVLALKQTGKNTRRQSYLQSNQVMTGNGSYQILASQSYTSEQAGDCLMFGAYVEAPSLSLTYSIDIRLNGSSAIPSLTTALTSGSLPVNLGAQAWQTGVRGFQWHLAPMDEAGLAFTLQLLASAPSGSPSWAKVSLVSMMVQL